MICPHGNRSDDLDPALMCAQCEADAERRDDTIDLIKLEALMIQPELPAELLPRPVGTLL